MAQALRIKPLLLVSALTAAAALSVSAGAQIAQRTGGIIAPKQTNVGMEPTIGMVQDWSHRHVIFTKARTYDETVAARLSQPRWDRMAQDPRYVMALTRRFDSEATVKANANPRRTLIDNRRGRPGTPTVPTTPDTEYNIQRDWSNVLGGGANGQGGKGIQGAFPAKYNFDVAQAPNCENDFVVFPTNNAGSTSSGSSETWLGTMGADSFSGGFFGTRIPSGVVTIGTTAPRQVALTATRNDNTGTNFQVMSGNNDLPGNQQAINLTNAVNRWTSQTGIRATQSGAEVTIISNTSGNVTDSLVTESGPSFALARTNGTPTAGQPTIVAFNQLYQGTAADACKGTWNQNGAVKAPNVMWSYNTGTGYTTETSPTLSYSDDAKHVAFVQRNGTSTELVLLRWKLGDGTAAEPAIPTTVTAAQFANKVGGPCASASCMFKLSLSTSGRNQQSYSSPFVDYAADVLWVGDNNGRLHKFAGVFKGTPTQVTTGFPAVVASGLALSSPVYDFAGNVYVGSQADTGNVGGKLHRINASDGSVFSSTRLVKPATASPGLREGPIVTDKPGTGSVFAFLFNDGTAGNGTTCDIAPNNDNACRVVARFTSNFASDAQPVQRAYVGRGNSTGSTLYAGAFNEAYYTNAPGAAMYIVGGDVANTFRPQLWKIPLDLNGVMQQSLPGPYLGPVSCDNGCIAQTWDWSPVTLFKNNSNEYFYFSMSRSADLGGCTGACLFMFNTANLQNTNSTVWGPNNVPRAALSVYGGTSGIVVDNISGNTGASQVYFAHLANGGNAVQASQSGLE